MQSSAFKRLVLSAPRSLSMPAAGIDISSGSVKCVQLVTRGGHLSLGPYAEIPLQEGVFVEGDIEKPEIITDVLRSVRLKHRVRYAVAALSERKAYLYQVIVPRGQENLLEAVEFDLEAHVPLSPAETLFDFEVVREMGAGTVVAVTAFARRVVESYEKAFAASGITLRALETESQALVRAALGPKDRTDVVMTVDMGKRSTRIAVADHGAVSYTATVDFGGDMLTTALMKRFSLDAPAAEEMKNAKGFLMGKDNAEVVEAVVSSISVLRDELVKHLAYWNNPTEEDVPRDPVVRMVIAGGNANMLGLAEYLSDTLGLPVFCADVWQNAFSINKYVPHMPAHESLEYAPAIGLALKYAHNNKW